MIIDRVAHEGVDLVGNALDRDILQQAGVQNASTLVLKLSDASEGLFAATVVREFAPDVPLVARVKQPQTVHRLYRVGVDFALTMGQVAGQLLAQHLLGEEYISLEQDLKLVKVDASGLVGRHTLRAGIRERTGCQVVAIERAGEVIVAFPADCCVEESDAIVLAGSRKALDVYYSQFQTGRSGSSAI